MNPIKPAEAKDPARDVNMQEVQDRISKINKILSEHDWVQTVVCRIDDKEFGKGKVKYLLVLKYQEHGWKVKHASDPRNEGYYELT
jgi:hypothetical protein